ncbi:NACHT domain-containing protein [Streptomyces sp. NPDC018031]|uniref:NACHT domain-containing protein n=1 Tax=Streptomyces sp. NPDC018031 TaxID=3365033 RepID=UPI0037A48BA5
MAGGRGAELLSRLGLAAASVLPPALLGAKFWSSVEAHPVGALLLLLGYAALLAVVAFLVKVYANVSDRWVGRAADALDGRLRRRISRFEREYRAFVLSHHRFIDLKGLATRGDYTPGLEEVFVDVSLVPRPAHEVSAESLAGTRQAGAVPVRRSIRDFLGEPAGTALAVIGAPGTGKTTLLKHLALELAGQRGRRGRRDLPVLLLLRDHTEAITADPRVTLGEVITASLRRCPAQQPPGWFDQRLREGRCVVLLDGLDEVAHEQDRRRVSAWVEEQMAGYEANDFILTSRPHGYQTAPVDRARVLQVRRFTGEQISRFVHGWYRAIERLSTGTADAGVAARATEEAQDLLDRLRARPMLYDLAANPLLLTMIANVHRYRGALPGSRAELYGEICEVLLWRRQEAKGAPVARAELTGAKKEVVVRELAHAMMTDRKRDIEAARAEEILRPILLRVAATVRVEDFLAEIVTSGLLVERERGLYAFAHLTLQEHLAALHIQQRGLGDVLAAHVCDDWWRETTLLYAARVDPARIVAACLDSGSVTALALAYDCAEEAAELDPEMARRLEELRQSALDGGTDPRLRRLLTAVTVTRQLRETVTLSEDTTVCARPVTRGLFHLFATERRLCTDDRLAGSPVDAVAAGPTHREAADFLIWLNDLLPDGSGYRLPTGAEVRDPGFRLVAHSGEHAFWCAPPAERPSGPPVLWVPEGVADPWPTSPFLSFGRSETDKVALLIGQLGLAEGLAAAASRDPAQTAPGGIFDVAQRIAEEDLQGFTEATMRVTQGVLSGEIRIDEIDVASFVLGVVLAVDDVRQRLRDCDRFSPEFLGRDYRRSRVAAWSIAVLVRLAGEPGERTFGRGDRRMVLFWEYVEPLLRGTGTARSADPTTRPSADLSLEPLAETALRDLRSRVTLLVRPRWLRPVVDRLGTALDTMLRALAVNHRAVDPGELPYLRLAAFALAATAEHSMRHPELADRYRAIAGHLTALERRADGTVTPNEAIALVRA